MEPIGSWRELARRQAPRARARAFARRRALDAVGRLPSRDGAAAGVRIVHLHFVFPDQRASFARQVDYLAAHFELVPLGEAVARLRAGNAGGRELAITFDDGFRNQLAHGAPILAERGISACFFLISGLLGGAGDSARQVLRERLRLPGQVELLSWADAERLLELGHEIGSHTRTHPDLASLPADQLREEVAGSRAELERRLGPVRHFSVPYVTPGHVPPEVARAAHDAGYESCATARRGVNRGAPDLYALRRHHIEADYPIPHVRWLLRRGAMIPA
jgi:peptidoglycan/xylan/chitin deacetylase (PgdA/CDA1 family)